MSRPEGALKMSELASASGVPAPTIKHYLREGLLGGGGEVVRTSRNMAYYPPEFVDRIRLIKRLQEDRYLPLRTIREVLDDDPARAEAMLELGDTLLRRADAAGAAEPRAAIEQRTGVPANVLDRLEELGVLQPGPDGYDADDATVVEAFARFRESGYDEALGFTVYDSLRYQRALQPLVEEEVRVLLNRLAGEVPVERAVEIVEAGKEPLRSLIGALHSKLLMAEVRRQQRER